jgi:hypothetical protein
MTKRDAFPVKAVSGSGHSTDGAHVFLEFEHVKGQKVAFAVPPDVASKLIDQAALHIDACTRIDPPARGTVRAFPAKGFAIGANARAGDLVLALNFGLGGSIAYQIPRDLAQRLHDELGKELAKPAPGKTG